MDVYGHAFDFLMQLPHVQKWPEMRSLIEREMKLRSRPWRLPIIACEAVGGAPQVAVPAVAAMACTQISILLVDDLLDEDPRGEYRRVGAAAAANLAVAFQTAGMEAILRSEARPEIKIASLDCLNETLLTTAFGQFLDTQNPTDEDSYWRMVKIKSSPFFGAAFYLGALLGGAANPIAVQMKRFAELYGELIQIHDDLNDVMAVPANPDWVQGRSPLPILYAETVNHPDRIRFQELRQAIPDPVVLTEAQAILIRCGAVSYCIHQLLQKHRAARHLFTEVLLVNSQGLEELLDSMIEPVKRLLNSINGNDSLVLIEFCDTAS